MKIISRSNAVVVDFPFVKECLLFTTYNKSEYIAEKTDFGPKKCKSRSFTLGQM